VINRWTKSRLGINNGAAYGDAHEDEKDHRETSGSVTMHDAGNKIDELEVSANGGCLGNTRDFQALYIYAFLSSQIVFFLCL
jgi:hypothetical protein